MPVVDSPTSKQKPSVSHLVSSPTPNQDSNNPANPPAPNAASINSLTISTMKTKKIKRNWIAICAIASLITSVIGTGGNLYLYYVQVNLQKEANLAHIEVDCPTLVCTDKLEIKNPGTAVARNVTVTLSIDTIQDNWKSSIDDISKFALTVTHTALNILVQKAQINTSANEVLNENAFILSLQSFPPDGKFDINLSLDYKKFATLKIYDVKLFPKSVYFDNLETLNVNDINTDFVDIYIKNKLKIASLSLSLNCNNCEGNIHYNQSTKNNKITVIISSLYYRVEDAYRVIDAQKLQEGYEWKGVASLEEKYKLPVGSNPISVPNPLYLQVLHTGTSDEIVSECQPPKCTHFFED